MKFAVPDKILQETTKCGYEYSCLTTGECGNLPKCKVEKRFDEKMLFVSTTEDAPCLSCPYKYSYGISHGHICTCPTHYAVYEQNKCYQPMGWILGSVSVFEKTEK
jgi:hypothetical protein